MKHSTNASTPRPQMCITRCLTGDTAKHVANADVMQVLYRTELAIAMQRQFDMEMLRATFDQLDLRPLFANTLPLDMMIEGHFKAHHSAYAYPIQYRSSAYYRPLCMPIIHVVGGDETQRELADLMRYFARVEAARAERQRRRLARRLAWSAAAFVMGAVSMLAAIAQMGGA